MRAAPVRGERERHGRCGPGGPGGPGPPGGDRCVVRVTGRQPVLPSARDLLRAVMLVHADFVDAGLELSFSPLDLDAWRAGLNGLRPGSGTGISVGSAGRVWPSSSRRTAPWS
ncbi:DUF5959 family protein [Kitasatospora phosalacinea]|uniref:DUF5959 family protein n=1 Tax=Kitasatospora phosalacinea TaxID=2065 RepID=A0ABW6GK67_9ACTN